MGEFDLTRLGSALRMLRRARGWTMADVAMFVRRDKQTVHRWEVGRVEPSLTVIAQLARLYGVSLASIVDPQNAVRDPIKKKSAAA